MRAGGRVDPTHEAMLDGLLSLLLAEGAILEAACGERRFWPTILENGRSVSVRARVATHA